MVHAQRQKKNPKTAFIYCSKLKLCSITLPQIEWKIQLTMNERSNNQTVIDKIIDNCLQTQDGQQQLYLSIDNLMIPLCLLNLSKVVQHIS